jgi:hypothetical protein
MMRDEDAFDVVGMLQEERGAARKRERHDVVGSARELLEKSERIARDASPEAPQGAPEFWWINRGHAGAACYQDRLARQDSL